MVIQTAGIEVSAPLPHVLITGEMPLRMTPQSKWGWSVQHSAIEQRVPTWLVPGMLTVG